MPMSNSENMLLWLLVRRLLMGTDFTLSPSQSLSLSLSLYLSLISVFECPKLALSVNVNAFQMDETSEQK